MKQFTLHKGERLKSRKEIGHLFTQGRSFAVYPYRVYFAYAVNEQAEHLQKKPKPPLQFGISAGKKHFKRAVDRNRIKRLTREAYRLQKLSLQELLRSKGCCLNLFFIYTGKEMLNFEEAFSKVRIGLKRLEAEIKKQPC